MYLAFHRPKTHDFESNNAFSENFRKYIPKYTVNYRTLINLIILILWLASLYESRVQYSYSYFIFMANGSMAPIV